MPHWYVLECEPQEEFPVCNAISALSVRVWLPVEGRPFKSRRGPDSASKSLAIEVPMLPGLMFVQAEIAMAYTLKDRVRDVEGIWCDAAGIPLIVAERELTRFKAEVEAYLDQCRQSIAKGKEPPPKPKALKINLGESGAREIMMKRLFGTVEAA